MRQLEGQLRRYCLAAATPFTLRVERMLQANKWAELLNEKVKPQSYTSIHEYRLDAQCMALLSKNVSVPSGIDTKEAAKQAWWEAEHRCAWTNAYIGSLTYGSNDPRDEFAYQYLLKVRAKVRYYMGSVPSELTAHFGPGSTLSCHAGKSTLPDKIETSPSTTVDAAYLAAKYLEKTLWFRSLVARGTLLYKDGSLSGWKTVRSSRWSSVRKNAKTDRSIEIGPDINVAMQLDIGRHLTRNLARKGWVLKKDLWTNVQDLHKRIACDASRHGFYATIDLKQASDSISQKLVEFLVSPVWYSVLDSLRTRYTSIDGRDVRIQKFSGMGNGYTFELESIIFAAFTAVAMEDAGITAQPGRNFFVFGDDIIVPTYCARLLVASLKRFGFETNVDKTFVKGPFRESCGGDYFRGVDVRPFFLKKAPNEPAEWITFANGIRRVGYDDSSGVWRDPAYLRLWRSVIDAMPSDVRRLRGPVSLGDLVIHDHESTWQTRTRNSMRFIRSYRPVNRAHLTFRQGGVVVGWEEFPDWVVLATRVYQFPMAAVSRVTADTSLPIARGIVPRGTATGYKCGWTPLVNYV